MTQIIPNLAEISANYDALFVDLWGCVHDGVRAYPEAVAALRAYRKSGGVVVLVTNSPRARTEVEVQIAGFGAPEDCWDTITTSGDSARAAAFQGAVGRKVWFIGTDEERAFFDPLKIIENPIELEQVSLDQAEGIICTGLFDPMQDPEVYRPDLEVALAKGMKLLCANPDIIVDRGETREWCAGAIAKLYTEMGGQSLYFGKPHAPIYDLARKRLSAIRADVPAARILAIGDGIRTDVLGAIDEGIDSLFITGGLAARETQTTDQPDAEALRAYLAGEGLSPTYAIGKLR